MQTIRRNLVLVLAVLLGLVTVTGIATATRAPETAESGATKVVLETTGGIAGIHETIEVTPAHPNKAMIVTLVQKREFRQLKDRYLPKNPCCDRFHYTLAVTYPNEQTKTVQTMDGADMPKILSDVIRLVRQTQV